MCCLSFHTTSLLEIKGRIRFEIITAYMKKIFYTLLILLFAHQAFTQDHKWKLGVSGGLSIPSGDFGTTSFLSTAFSKDINITVNFGGFPLPVPLKVYGVFDELTGGGAKNGNSYSLDYSYNFSKHFGIAAMYKYGMNDFNGDGYKPTIYMNFHSSLLTGGDVGPLPYTFTSSSTGKPWQMHSIMIGPNYEQSFWKGYFDMRILVGATYVTSSDYNSAASVAGQNVAMALPSISSIGVGGLAGLYYSYPIYVKKKKTVKTDETTLRYETPNAKPEKKIKYSICLRPGVEYFYATTKQSRAYTIDRFDFTFAGNKIGIPAQTLSQDVTYTIQMYMLNIGLVYVR